MIIEPILGTPRANEAAPFDEYRQLVTAFLNESMEIASGLERLLLDLEQAPGSDELLHDIFRAAHTLKGNAACLEFDGMTAFAHVVEELLDRLREDRAGVTPACISLLLQCVDVFRDLSARCAAGTGGKLTHQERELMTALSSIDRRDVSIARPADWQERTEGSP